MSPRKTKTPTSIDLFCGAGGLTLGLHRAGCETALASDLWEPAVQTLEANFRNTPVLAADARELSGADLLSKAGLSDPPTLIAGGPPCQGFSSAGARKHDDHRNSLVGEFARLIVEVRPTAFLFENVEGFLTSAGGGYVFDLLDPLIEAGYRVALRKFNVANWGVPQLRKRVVAVGVLGLDPPVLQPTHRAYGAPGAERVGHDGLPPAPTVLQALEGLPEAALTAPGVPPEHFVGKLSTLDLQRIQGLGEGQTMRDLPEELQHPSYARRANRRVADGMPTERRGGAPAGLRRLRGDSPSKAITGAAQREMIHPTLDRPLTLRECARLQTFPDDFVFCGNLRDRQVLVGNAVPPLFAEHVGDQLLAAVAASSPDASLGGALVDFEVTSGDGMSPALRAVVDAVTTRYSGVEQLRLGGL